MRAVLILALLAGTARADELTRAKALEASLEYEQALAIVDVLLAKGGADPARFVELELLAGRLAGGLDRAEAAEVHFSHALAVSPLAALPDGSSPKITGPFAAARAYTRALVVEISTETGDVAVTVVDATGLAREIEITVVDGAGVRRRERAGRVALRAGESPAEVTVLDGRGNRIWIGAAPARQVRRAAAPRRAVIARPSTWLVVAGVGLAAGGLAAWRFGAAQADFDRLRTEGGHDFTELEALERSGRRWGIAANAGFGVALAGGIASGILYLRRAPDRPYPAVTWHYTGTGLTVAARF